MSDIAVRAEGLSKEYRIGGKQEGYKTLRDSLADAVASPFRRASQLFHGQAYGAANLNEIIWALNDLSFEVKKGEVVGIIGRNGAGKSTLLKILSRITDPSSGYIEVFGRVGALLEVGTGFHPELTGRENVYLNGAILGMSRQEINRKFDEIVDFAEVEKFIDTPVKHYSSGMGLRLGFSVAAHLEPEILVVDEVLAVGDFSFQAKCLGKMSAVAQQGRTVLFVSHNLAAVRHLCDCAMLLNGGSVGAFGAVDEVIDKYVGEFSNISNEVLFDTSHRSPQGSGRIRFTRFAAFSTSAEFSGPPRTGADVRFEVGYEMIEDFDIHSLLLAINIRTTDGIAVTSLGNRYTRQTFVDIPKTGTIICEVPQFPLMPGVYSVELVCRANDVVSEKRLEAAAFNVIGTGTWKDLDLPQREHAHFVFDHSLSVTDLIQLHSHNRLGGTE